MPKPELESHRSATSRSSTGDATLVLYHAPGQEWEGAGGKDAPAVHEYWEEVLILKGRLFDKTLGKWFGEQQYCCRPPGMVHGPWVADPTEGCEEIVFIRYDAAKDASKDDNP